MSDNQDSVSKQEVQSIIEKWQAEIDEYPSYYEQSDVPLVLDDLRELVTDNNQS